MEAGITQGSPVSPILLATHTTGLIQWVEERVQAEGLSLVDGQGWVATGKDLNQVVEILEACAAGNVKWALRRDLQFEAPQMKASHFTCRGGHKKHLRPKLTAKIKVGDGFVQFNKKAT